MNFRRKLSPTSVQLPFVFAIGFSGHRDLQDQAKSREILRKALAEWKSRVPGIVYAVSSAAAGGDLLFGETCQELNIPLRVLLPFSAQQFRADFDEETWARAEQVFAKALTVEVLGKTGTPEELYYQCGIETVQQCNLLIALWDGGPAKGKGGTADMVQLARRRGRVVLWIDSNTGEIRHFNEEQLSLRDPEMEFLNSLPDPVQLSTNDTPLGRVQTWFEKVDAQATRSAPQFRRLAAIPIFCTAAAALLSSRSSTAITAVVWLWMGTALAIMAAMLPTIMRLSQRQTAWTRMRTASEICRSCLSLWQTPAIYDVVGPETVPELTGMLASLNYLKMSDPTVRGTSLQEFKAGYRQNRIAGQLDYFQRHAGQSELRIRRYRWVTWTSVAVAISINALLLANAHGLIHWITARARPSLAIFATTLFQIATVAGALLVVNDFERRRDRYRELHRMLVEWDTQLDLAKTWSTILTIAVAAEKAMLAELIEWRSHIRNRKVPQK
jgi:hypothetical protein